MKNSSSTITPIYEVRGPGLWSAMAGRYVTVRGVVTGVGRRGFFIQNTKPGPDATISDALYVFSPGWKADKGTLLDVSGKVTDYVKGEYGKPVPQIKLDEVKLIKQRGPAIRPFELTAENVPADSNEQAIFLNGLESMLVSIEAGQTFISPSNAFGDYVLNLDADGPVADQIRTEQGGVLVDHQNPLRWYPGFRMINYAHAPRLNVGSKLLSRVVGPLNYRVEAFQIAVDHPIDVEQSHISVDRSALKPEAGFLTIMTMNGFNLDMHIESGSKVKNPFQDVDDDWGDGRFHSLAQAVVLQANTPDIVALQEIQDNDGAEMTEVVDASETYRGLIETIKQLSDIEYKWIDIAPQAYADGGQPGGSIRNGFLYNPGRVELVEGKVRSIGLDEPAFEGSRKPLLVHFRETHSGNELACLNVHLASKRHQRSIFAPEKPGHDAKLAVRVQQAEIIRDELCKLRQGGMDYYVTGDFNDTEESETLAALTGVESINLVNHLPPAQRYDYNHRGKLQTLMHGIVPKSLAEKRAEYDIIHGNELLGAQPGNKGDRPSDHAYVIAKISMNA
jgi:predicted extracellular nuclease